MRHSLIGAGLMLLAACSGSEEKSAAGNDSAAAGEKRAPPVSSVTLRPGEWELTTEVVEMNIPGLPAGVMPKEAMQKTTLKTCLKPEQTGKPDASFFSGQKNPNCTYEGFEMTAGTVKGTISCPSAQGTQKMTLTGQYQPESYDMRMDMESERMTMKMHTAGKRLGECPAG